MRLSWLLVGGLLGALGLTACGTTLGASASPARTASTSSQPSESAGSIEGAVGYPADVLEALAVYAVATDGSRFVYVEKAAYGRLAPQVGTYKLLGVAPGDYFVLTAVRDLTDPRVASAARGLGSRHFDAGYTKSVLCGLKYGCNDHTLVAVHVRPGATLRGIDPGDWYVGDPNFYPLVPEGGPRVLNIGSPPSSFQDPRQAAIYFAQLHTSARYVASSNDCQLNRACLWLTGERDGQAAAYFTSEAGSNGLLRTCTFYLTDASSGWQYLDSNCQRATTAFPAVGSSGQLTIGFGGTGCINIHSEPGLTTKVVACLPEGMNVTLDDGPYYLPEPTPSPDFGIKYWWHVANRGWVVHRYVMYSA